MSIWRFFRPRKVSLFKLVAFEEFSNPGAIPPGFTALCFGRVTIEVMRVLAGTVYDYRISSR